MVSLNVHNNHSGGSGGCGSSCGAGLEQIYPTTAVRYGAMRWIGEFRYEPGTIFKCGAKVVVQTDRGIELGEQVSLTCHGCDRSVSREQIKRYIENSGAEFYRLGSGRILREANVQDVDEHARLNAHGHEDVDRCALLAAQLALDMKVITAEHLLGGERIVFYFRSESRIDFRQLVKELARQYQTRIEMRQVGARDEARLVADYEVCGRECCCKNFLKKLRPVGMKMAKLQKSTLDPSKVSGRCGRLRCCLRYEHEGYESLAAKLPRLGQRVETEFGRATVIDRQILTQLVLVRTDDQREITIPVEELRGLSLPDRSLTTADEPNPPDDRRSSAEPAADEDHPLAPPMFGRASGDDPESEGTIITDDSSPAGPERPSGNSSRPWRPGRRRRGRGPRNQEPRWPQRPPPGSRDRPPPDPPPSDRSA